MDVDAPPFPISPITKLSHDVLELIFTLNADMDNAREYDSARNEYESSSESWSRPSALDTTRRTSQVCPSWRNMLLYSPHIWGQVIRLDRFKRKRSGEWRNEVMRRTGNAKLCIKGKVQTDILDLSAFFVQLLSTDWARIRKLDCRIGGRGISDDTFVRLFCRSAPHLESFTMMFGERQKLDMGKNQLFAGDAPLLKKLSTCRVSYELPGSSQTMNLLSLKLEEGDVDPGDLLQLMKKTPLLEDLEINNVTSKLSNQLLYNTEFELVHLPYLRSLRLITPWNFGLSVAVNVKPAIDCRLYWESRQGQPRTTTTDRELIVACQILECYSKSSFSNKTPTSLVLDVDARSFRLETIPISPKPLPLKLYQFIYPTTFSVYLISTFPPGYGATLVNSLSECDLHTITQFRFDPNPSSELKGKRSKLEGLFVALSSVETLMVSNYGLEILLDGSEDTDIIFPSLQRVELSKSRATPSDFDNILPFLESRQRKGFSVQIMDLSSNPTGNWRLLDKFHGMTVLWATKRSKEKYICGSGDEDKLNLRYYLESEDSNSDLEF